MKSKTRPRNYKRYAPPLKRTASSTATAIIQPEKSIAHLFPTEEHYRRFEEGVAMLEKLAQARGNRGLQQLINQSTNQSINQSINQSTNQPT